VTLRLKWILARLWMNCEVSLALCQSLHLRQS